MPFYRAFPDLPLVSISDNQRLPMPPVNWLGTVHHGLPASLLFRRRLDPEGGYFAFLGRISPEKRPDRAIEIAAQTGIPLKIAAKIDNADRDYWNEVIAPLVAKHGDVVEFVGEINDQQKAALPRQCARAAVPDRLARTVRAGDDRGDGLRHAGDRLPLRIGAGSDRPRNFRFHRRDPCRSRRRGRAARRTFRARVRRQFETRFSAERMARDYVNLYERLVDENLHRADNVRTSARARKDACTKDRLNDGRLSRSKLRVLPRRSQFPEGRPARSRARRLRDRRHRVLPRPAPAHAQAQRYFCGVRSQRRRDQRPRQLRGGLYYRDTRHLSHYYLTINGNVRPILLSSTLRDDNSVLTVDVTNPDIAGEAGTTLQNDLLHIRRMRFISGSRMCERITLTNFHDLPASVALELHFASDFADLFEVRGAVRIKRGVRLPPEVGADQVLLAYTGLDDITRKTRADLRPRTHLARAATSRSSRIELDPRKSVAGVLVEIDCGEPGSDCELPLRKRPGALLPRRARGFAQEVLAARPRIDSTNEVFNQSMRRCVADTYMLVTETEYGPYPYAGIPGIRRCSAAMR